MGFNEEERQSTPPPGGWPPAAKETAHGVEEIVYHGAAKKPDTRKIDAMSRRKHTIRREAGLHLTDRQREMLGTAWNGYVNRCARISLRHFARVHNIPSDKFDNPLQESVDRICFCFIVVHRVSFAWFV